MPTYTHDFNGSRLGLARKNRRVLSNSIVKQDHINAVMKFLLFGRLPAFHYLLSETILTRLEARYRHDLLTVALFTPLYAPAVFFELI